VSSSHTATDSTTQDYRSRDVATSSPSYCRVSGFVSRSDDWLSWLGNSWVSSFPPGNCWVSTLNFTTTAYCHIMLKYLINFSTEQPVPWGASSSDNQEIFRILCNLKVRYCVHSSPRGPALSQMNPIANFIPHLRSTIVHSSGFSSHILYAVYYACYMSRPSHLL